MHCDEWTYTEKDGWQALPEALLPDTVEKYEYPGTVLDAMGYTCHDRMGMLGQTGGFTVWTVDTSTSETRYHYCVLLNAPRFTHEMVWIPTLPDLMHFQERYAPMVLHRAILARLGDTAAEWREEANRRRAMTTWGQVAARQQYDQGG